MLPEDRSLDGYAFTMLELLAREAPPEQFEDVVRGAAAAGATEADLALLTSAKDRSLEIRQLFSRRQQREAGLSALVDTARDLTLPYSLDTLLKVITRRARLLLGLDMSWLSLHDAEDGASVVRAADGHASAITVGFRVPLTGGVGRHARERSAPFWTPDYLRDEAFAHSDIIDNVVRTEGLHAIMAVPLQHEESTFGVLYVADRNVRHFLPDEISLMTSLADLAAVAIERTTLLERTRAEVTELARDTSRARDSSTAAQRLHSVHSRLIDLVLDGGDLRALVDSAAGELGGALVVRGPAGKDIVSGGEPSAPAEGKPGAEAPPGAAGAVDAVVLDSAILDAHAEGGPVRCGSEHLWVCPVTAGAENLGTLVLRRGEDLTSDGVRLLGLVAQSVAVLLLMQRSTAVAEGQVRDQLFNDLLNASQLPPHQLAERARRLAVDLNEPHVVVVARPEGGAQGRAVVWASSYAHRMSGLKYADGGRIVLLLPGSDPCAAAKAVSRELTTLLGHPVTVGTAGPLTTPAAVKATYQEAQRCLDALTALGGTGSTASPRELGFLGLLLADKHDIGGFIASAIGPVLDYDSQQQTELLRTLEAYFTSGSSPTRAAEALHVHPNTVSRRLERITELLGADWQEPAQALEVQLALRLQRARHTLGGRPATDQAAAQAPVG
ncbi:helix-turn-helix domain-containing protein [Streptomyces coeruleoprunus]|uniref:Helix-turn-helix domain-containing protein n=1 Tax=Streptomyces coeruleoprunus TaxID=285563 RepID=A0ABV9XKI7_9ACTN